MTVLTHTVRRDTVRRGTGSGLLLGLLMAAATLLASTAQADDFRVSSRIYSGKEKNPVSENLTLFRAGVVYDYLDKESRVAVFDQSRGKFILLDVDRKVKAEISTDQLMAVTHELQESAAKSISSWAKFQADPKFEVTVAQDSGEITCANPHLTYRVVPLKAESEAAQQFRDFSDWYARLNAVTTPQGNLPFPRLFLNAELAKQSVVPQKVFLTGSHGLALRSEHEVAWKLLPKDHDRITKTGAQLVSFTQVSMNEFNQAKVARK